MKFSATLLLVLAVAAPALACPFCSSQGQTLSKELEMASFVLYGLPMPNDKKGDDGEEETTFVIEEVVKSHDLVKGKKSVTLPRYIPNPDKTTRFLVFCDIFKDRIDPYRGIAIKDQTVVTYLKSAVALKDKDSTTRLRFFFEYLESKDPETSMDAYREFANASAKEVIDMIGSTEKKTLREKLILWLGDRNTSVHRFGLYGYLLGLCGQPEDTKLLHQVLEDKDRGVLTGIDGILAAIVMLDPPAGWKFVTGILGNPKEEFTKRYAALRTVRFFWTDHPVKMPGKTDLTGALALLLEQGDIADLAIEDLRKWKRFEYTDKILSLYERDTHKVSIVQRSIIRYCLSASQDPKAAQFVEARRKENPSKVKDVETLLRLDEPAAPKKE